MDVQVLVSDEVSDGGPRLAAHGGAEGDRGTVVADHPREMARSRRSATLHTGQGGKSPLQFVAFRHSSRYTPCMNIPGLRSPHELVGGIVHFGRMLDKIKLHAQGRLSADYIKNLGTGFDGRVCSLLGVKYEDVITRVKLGGEDQDILEWCFTNGRKPTEEEIDIFNSYLRKRGWRDDASARLAQRKKEYGIADRHDVQTFFDLIDIDEGREVRTQF